MVVARSGPSATAPPVARVAATTPLTAVPSVLPVIGRRIGADGAEWLRVRLPARPNGTTGWVRAGAGHAVTTPWQIVIRRSARSADILEAGTRRATFPVIVGRSSTPTPTGTFFVVETLHIGRRTEGPWALATSAYSDVLHEFAGGNGQIALHGRVGLPELLGTFSSHGCVRFANAAITWIAKRVGPGARIVIEP